MRLPVWNHNTISWVKAEATQLSTRTVTVNFFCQQCKDTTKRVYCCVANARLGLGSYARLHSGCQRKQI
jgi:hypothetical protein